MIRGIDEKALLNRESWERSAANAYQIPDEQVLQMIAEIRRLRAIVDSDPNVLTHDNLIEQLGKVGESLNEVVGRVSTFGANTTIGYAIQILVHKKLDGNESCIRTPQDYAIEFGQYLAAAAENYIAARNRFDQAEEDKLGDIDDLTDHFNGLSNAIGEFRKRAQRAEGVS